MKTKEMQSWLSINSPNSLAQQLVSSIDISNALKSASIAELKEVSQIIRNRILEVVSINGGHLSSTLGAVELIVGMHSIFECNKNPFIYDVSHQCYAHKIITGRYNDFSTLRQINGVSGFSAPYESNLDYFIAGHSSTSISLAVGCAKAKKLKGDNFNPVVMIGDGAMSAGLVYEAINELGELKLPVVIILNDNEMSIAKPIGAISRVLSTTIASPFYQKIKKKTKRVLDLFPDSALYIAKRFEESLKLITPGILFEELGIDYIGPIDGNDIEGILHTLKIAKNMDTPVVVHAQTIKGKGYQVAEGKYEKWHSVGPFDLKTGKSSTKASINKSPTQTFSDKLLQLAKDDNKIVGLTAAMPSGTGLDKLMDSYLDRFSDVAIAEQHAVTSACAMAREGLKPFVAIYSTFLQRAFDQIIHDCSIMKMPVRFCIDRGGLVGEDGETHQGLLDISYLKSIPNMVISAPRDNKTLEYTLEFSSKDINFPYAFRYPRGNFMLDKMESSLNNSEYSKCLEGFRAEFLIQNCGDILFIGYGNGVGNAFETIQLLKKDIDLLDLVFIKPLDSEMLLKCFKKYKNIFIFSDSYKINGVGESVIALASDCYCRGEINFFPKIISFEVDDMFVKHGNTDRIKESLGIDNLSISKKIEKILH